MALIGSWPGPVHEGHGKACYYVDDRCNDKQFEALSEIITGRAGGGGPFSIYASIIEEYDEPKRARINFQSRDIRDVIKVGRLSDSIEASLVANMIKTQHHNSNSEFAGLSVRCKMSFCYYFEMWTIISLTALLVVNMIGLATLLLK